MKRERWTGRGGSLVVCFELNVAPFYSSLSKAGIAMKRLDGGSHVLQTMTSNTPFRQRTLHWYHQYFISDNATNAYGLSQWVEQNGLGIFPTPVFVREHK